MMKSICIFTVLYGALHAALPPPDQTPPPGQTPSPGRTPQPMLCASSLDCPPIAPCCRDIDGKLVDRIRDDSWNIVIPTGGGYCTSWRSRPDEACSMKCGCSVGHVCYRTITGRCCPPLTCWKKEKAEEDRNNWLNCLRRRCPLPPAANPGGGGGGLGGGLEQR